MKTLSKMDKEPLVLAFKYLMGYTKDKTEEFTADFEAFVKTWQKDNGLTADGKIGEKTASVLIAKLPNVSKTKNRKGNYAAGVQVLVGMTGDAVDGIFGTKTKTAVINKQTEGKLNGDGIVGSKSWQYFITGEVKEHTQNKQPVIYRQGDKRWKNYYYGVKGSKSPTCGAAGCGPTSAAMILATWVDSKIIPPNMCDYSMEHGYRTANSGTSGGLFKSIAKTYFGDDYGNNKYFTTSNIDNVIKTLDAGGLVVACMGPGKFTSSGHYILLWKVSEDGSKIMVNDPASAASNRSYGTINEIKTQRKGFYCFPKPDNIK